MQKPVAHAAVHVSGSPGGREVVLSILFSLSFCHLLNDVMQSLIAALYPMLKEQFQLDFMQIGLITLAFQLTASLLQPTIGTYTDRRPMPYSLSVGMGMTLIGLVLLSIAESYTAVLVAAAMVGTGSAVFHPESSRIARLASGGRYGFAQSLFQVGGNFGQAIGPLLAALIVLPRGQSAIGWFSLLALAGMLILAHVGRWYAGLLRTLQPTAARHAHAEPRPRAQVMFFLFLLILLLFSKNVYSASLSSYFTFYLIDRFQLSVRDAQLLLFTFMTANAVGTLIGGPLSDRIGRRLMIWISILGALPFTMLLPYANLFWLIVLIIIIGLIMASAFPAILVYAQELLPGRVGFVAGMFFGFAFGLGGLGAAALGRLADVYGIEFVFRLCAYLPAIGLVVWLLPNLDRPRAAGVSAGT